MIVIMLEIPKNLEQAYNAGFAAGRELLVEELKKDKEVSDTELMRAKALHRMESLAASLLGVRL